jgi:hypothetical protein
MLLRLHALRQRNFLYTSFQLPALDATISGL